MRSFAPVLSLFLLLCAGAARAQFDAPVWYVEYEVTMKADYTASGGGARGPMSTTWKLERVFSSTAKLDLRNMGQVLSMDMTGFDAEKYKKMTPAEQLQVTQQMMEAMQYTANWMPGPLDVGDEQDAMLNHMRAVSVPVRLDYEATTTGNNLVDETGGKYDYWEQTTATVTGGSIYLGDQMRFEMNTSSNKYWLVLPCDGQDQNPNRNDLKWVTVTKYREAGKTAWGDEERKTHDSALDAFGSVKFEGLPNGLQTPMIMGTLDGSGTIAGQQSFNARLGGVATDVPVTITFKYRLTQTPPAATAKK